MRTVLLGAGHIGQTIARLLGRTGDYEVTVVDRSAEALALLDGEPVRTRPDQLDRTITGTGVSDEDLGGHLLREERIECLAKEARLLPRGHRHGDDGADAHPCSRRKSR